MQNIAIAIQHQNVQNKERFHNGSDEVYMPIYLPIGLIIHTVIDWNIIDGPITIYLWSDSGYDDMSDLGRDEGEEDEDGHYCYGDKEEEEGWWGQRRQHQR